MKNRVAKFLYDVAEVAGRSVTRLPGIMALVCATVGVGLVTDSYGWALIAAVPFLLAIDRRL